MALLHKKSGAEQEIKSDEQDSVMQNINYLQAENSKESGLNRTFHMNQEANTSEILNRDKKENTIKYQQDAEPVFDRKNIEISQKSDEKASKKSKKAKKKQQTETLSSVWWEKCKSLSKEQKAVAEDFFAHVNIAYDVGRIDVRGDNLYYLPEPQYDGRGLHFLRNGLFMGEFKKKRFEPSQPFALVWVVISLTLAVVIGVVGRAYLLPMILGETAGAPSTESVFIQMIQETFTNKINLPFIGGLFICGILAAIMSTADSQLLVCSSSVSADIYQGIFKPSASDKEVLNIGRITTIIVAALAFIIAWDPNSSVMALVSDAWAGLGAAFGPLVVMSLFWKRTNLPGAIAGLLSGALPVIIWDYIPIIGGQTPYVATGLYSLVVGFIISLLFIVVVSLMTKAPEESIIEEFELYKGYEEYDK